MAIIRLNDGFETTVDDELYDTIRLFEWRATKEGPNNLVYVRRSFWYQGTTITLRLHRWIIGAPPGILVDHRDGDTLNNKSYNLRIATPSQNGANTNLHHGKSGLRGVFPCQQRDGTPSGKFKVQIRFEGRTLYFGVYGSKQAAYAVYEAKRRELFGDFAPGE